MLGMAQNECRAAATEYGRDGRVVQLELELRKAQISMAIEFDNIRKTQIMLHTDADACTSARNEEARVIGDVEVLAARAESFRSQPEQAQQSAMIAHEQLQLLQQHQLQSVMHGVPASSSPLQPVRKRRGTTKNVSRSKTKSYVRSPKG